MKKARRLFILFTLALLTAGCKKNIKSDIQAELTPESSTDSEYTTSDEESTAFVNNTELKAFYKVNGMPVETVYAVRDFKVETDDEKDVYI